MGLRQALSGWRSGCFDVLLGVHLAHGGEGSPHELRLGSAEVGAHERHFICGKRSLAAGRHG